MAQSSRYFGSAMTGPGPGGSGFGGWVGVLLVLVAFADKGQQPGERGDRFAFLLGGERNVAGGLQPQPGSDRTAASGGLGRWGGLGGHDGNAPADVVKTSTSSCAMTCTGSPAARALRVLSSAKNEARGIRRWSRRPASSATARSTSTSPACSAAASSAPGKSNRMPPRRHGRAVSATSPPGRSTLVQAARISTMPSSSAASPAVARLAWLGPLVYSAFHFRTLPAGLPSSRRVRTRPCAQDP